MTIPILGQAPSGSNHAFVAYAAQAIETYDIALITTLQDEIISRSEIP